MSLEKEIIPYEEALILKELGFNEDCFAWYNYGNFVLFGEDLLLDGYAGERNRPFAPTFSQAFKWFRDNHGLFIAPNVISYENGPYLWFFVINSTILPFGTDLGETDDFNTYEEAELACLRKLIEIVKQK